MSSSRVKMDKNDGGDANADRYATCCTGPLRTNIQKAAYVVAFVGFVLNLIDAFVAFLSGTAWYRSGIVVGVICLVLALICLSVIVAQRERKHLLFLPYLILMGAVLIIVVLVGILALIMAIAAPQLIVNGWDNNETVEEFRLEMLITLVVIGYYVALNGWFYSIIFRAYKHANLTIGKGKVTPPSV